MAEDKQLIEISRAQRALALAKTIPEKKMIRDQAQAIAVYLRRQKGCEEAAMGAAELKLRAERQIGEMLKTAPKHKGGGDRKSHAYKEHSLHDERGDIATLKDRGISEIQSHRWQKVAGIDEPIFEKYLAESRDRGEIVTTAGMVRVAHREAPKGDTPPLPPGTYSVIYADPPWQYGDERHALERYGPASRHYPSMTIAELCALDIQSRAHKNAVLFLWVTSPLLEESFAVIKAWGFQYKSSFVWDKVKHNFGHYNSMRHEFLLVCTRGSCLPQIKTLFDSVLSIERSARHSEKPEEVRAMIDALYPVGPRLELFARKKVEGWERYGNEL
jgi:N6-adenosine-specific RNA methylase IME4